MYTLDKLDRGLSGMCKVPRDWSTGSERSVHVSSVLSY